MKFRRTNPPACTIPPGTTSDPKGVLFSHRNMISNISSICRGFRFSRENEVHLVFLPLGHTASINYSMLPCFLVGGRIVLAEDFWHIRTKNLEIDRAVSHHLHGNRSNGFVLYFEYLQKRN